MSEKIPPNFRKEALEYVEAQLETMAKYGSAPTLSAEEYRNLVDEVAAVGLKIWERSVARSGE